MQRIEASLAAGGFTVTRDSVAGRRTVIGRRSRVALSARRHTFVLVGVFKSDASPEHLDRFLDEAGQYASTMKRAGTCAVAVAVVESADQVGDWARSRVREGGTARSFPVLVDVAGGRVALPDGDGNTDYVRGLVEAHVVPSLERA